MKVQFVVIGVVGMLCLLNGAQAASAKRQRRSTTDTLVDEIEAVVSTVETAIKTAIAKAEEALTNLEEEVVTLENSWISSATSTLENEVTTLLGENSTLSKFVECINITGTLTTLNTEVVEAGTTCINASVSPIVSAILTLDNIATDVADLLETATSVSSNCSSLDVLCELTTAVTTLTSLYTKAVTYSLEVASAVETLGVDISADALEILLTEITSCLTGKAETLIAETVVTFVEDVATCVAKLV